MSYNVKSSKDISFLLKCLSNFFYDFVCRHIHKTNIKTAIRSADMVIKIMVLLLIGYPITWYSGSLHEYGKDTNKCYET